jgi:hypothetical protein
MNIQRTLHYGILVAFLSLSAMAFAGDVNGTWTSTFQTQIGDQHYTYTFKLDSEKLTGSAKSDFGDVQIENGVVKGDEISFTETLEIMGQKVPINYTGKINGDQINFTRKSTFATEQLVARRSAPAPAPAPAANQAVPAQAAADIVPALPGMSPEAMEAMKLLLARVKANTMMPDLPGTGPFPATYEVAPGTEFTVYHPKDLAKASSARKLAVYAWANGGCAYDGANQRFHLLEIASHGYVAITPGPLVTGPRGALGAGHLEPLPDFSKGETRKAQTPALVRSAIDWILAENSRPDSPYHSKIDSSRIAVAGGSCGGLIAMDLAQDARVKAVELHNSGTFPQVPAMMSATLKVTKDNLAKLHTPILYITGGPEDIAQPNALDDFKRINHVPVFVADRPGVGHIGMSLDPNGEGTKIELHWLEWQLFGNKQAALMFTGKDCSPCRDLFWKTYQKGL